MWYRRSLNIRIISELLCYIQFLSPSIVRMHVKSSFLIHFQWHKNLCGVFILFYQLVLFWYKIVVQVFASYMCSIQMLDEMFGSECNVFSFFPFPYEGMIFFRYIEQMMKLI